VMLLGRVQVEAEVELAALHHLHGRTAAGAPALPCLSRCCRLVRIRWLGSVRSSQRSCWWDSPGRDRWRRGR
jgi:hypothetical protein